MQPVPLDDTTRRSFAFFVDVAEIDMRFIQHMGGRYLLICHLMASACTLRAAAF